MSIGQTTGVSVILCLFIYRAISTYPLSLDWLFLPVAFYSTQFIWYFVDIHKRLGPWEQSEPKSHFVFAVKTFWVLFLFKLGNIVLGSVFGMDTEKYTDRIVKWELSPEHKFLFSNSRTQDILYALAAFYMIDFLRYWAHRIGHFSFFYKTFPFSHAHHHNQIFVNPYTTAMSPMFHLSTVGTYIPILLIGANGLHQASIMCWAMTMFPTATQHLGFDPLPFVTRWNHYYFFGALPWIPLYHMYHHNPFVKASNFGNSTMFWDYLHGTVAPETVYHIENGRAMDKVLEKFKDLKELDQKLNALYTVGQGLNKFDLNAGWNMKMFKWSVL